MLKTAEGSLQYRATQASSCCLNRERNRLFKQQPQTLYDLFEVRTLLEGWT